MSLPEDPVLATILGSLRSEIPSTDDEGQTPDLSRRRSEKLRISVSSSSGSEAEDLYGFAAARKGKARNKAIDSFKQEICKKPGWAKKIFDPEITKRYKQEAMAQGMDEADVDVAIGELIEFTTLSLKVEGVEHSDTQILEPLRCQFVKLLNRLVAMPPHGAPDWHPGSGEKVLDLIHPSIYCYVEGVSVIEPDSPYVLESNRLAARRWNEGLYDVLKRQSRAWAGLSAFEASPSGHQWLPAVYAVDPDGKTKIRSYINNLDRAKHSELYEAFERGFECVLPMLARVSGQQLVDRHLLVITKACNYVLKPGESYQGIWHVEGMPSEMIIASAIYYYESTWLDDDGLAFRRKRMAYDDEKTEGANNNNWRNSVQLGAIPTHQGRVIVFRNDMQHCVMLLHNPSKTETATRKIVCWFLCHPEAMLISTADVPQQQWDHNPEHRRGIVLLALICRRLLHGCSLPRDLLLYIMRLSFIGMSFEEAKEYRAKLMHERKFLIKTNNNALELGEESDSDSERSYSLCEH